MVGVVRFELTTTRSQSECATRLRYTPIGFRRLAVFSTQFPHNKKGENVVFNGSSSKTKNDYKVKTQKKGLNVPLSI